MFDVALGLKRLEIKRFNKLVVFRFGGNQDLL